MRLTDLLESFDIKRQAKRDVVNFITPLISSGKDKVALSTILAFLETEPDYAGTKLDKDLIISISPSIKQILKIESNPEDGGELYVYFLNSVKSDRYVNRDQEEVEKENIKKSAMKTVKRKLEL